MPSRRQSTTRDTIGPTTRFRVTHPFHPLRGQEFELVDHRRTWGEDRVYFLDASGELKRLPASWTSAGALNVFVAMSGGRAHFQVEDLLALAALIARQREVRPPTKRRKNAPGVSSK